MTEPKQAGPSETCPTCGCPVKVEGRTTHYFQPLLEKLENRDDLILQQTEKIKSLEAQLKECVKASADFAGRNVTLHCENLKLNKRVQAYRQVAIHLFREYCVLKEGFIDPNEVDAEAERLMKET